ncbi:hypothetical protein AVEN_239690-1 [Araneus ventricosus]|uniref:Uncharacterized protein n=1 Tax=Araneus ventricosus TaxID=182803 RepID=A0A4Y2CT07_ARAVE|nr:hypothetical protein AVEN_239690-1 [Araneus ventricosus]
MVHSSLISSEDRLTIQWLNLGQCFGGRVAQSDRVQPSLSIIISKCRIPTTLLPAPPVVIKDFPEHPGVSF